LNFFTFHPIFMLFFSPQNSFRVINGLLQGIAILFGKKGTKRGLSSENSCIWKVCVETDFEVYLVNIVQ
jgi:hypothetical protein